MKRMKIVMKICSMVAKIMILMRKSEMMDLPRIFEQHYKTQNCNGLRESVTAMMSSRERVPS